MSQEPRQTSFRQFNHGSTTVKFVEASAQKREFIKRILKVGWGMEPTNIMRIASSWDSKTRNFRIECNGRAYLLKEGHPEHPGIRDISNQVMDFCELNGARAPHMRRTNHGWTYYGQKCILSLYNFIEGENFDGSREELKEAAIRLAQLDKALAKCPLATSLLREKGMRTCHKPQDAKSILEFARLRGARDETEEEFLSAIGYLEFKSASLAAADPGRLRTQLIHSNVHPHNALFSPEGKLLAFLDFESLSFSQRAREVAFAMHRLARAYGKGTERNNDEGSDIIERAKDFLSAYNSENPLEEAEIRAIPALLQDEALCRVLTVLRNHYAERDFRKDRDFLKRLTMLKETELFDFL